LELTSRSVDLIAEGIDVTIRMGPMPDSRLVATRLGTIQRYLCAAPSYLARRGSPQTLEELHNHDTVEMLGADGRPRPWSFSNGIDQTLQIEAQPRLSVNDPATIHRLVVNGAGVGCLSGYLCTPDVEAGRLVRLLPEWTMPALDVNVVFPSSRALSPTVRAFVEFVKDNSAPGRSWQNDAAQAPA
jgi:DNA-binding transcriptional LysR family regulator